MDKSLDRKNAYALLLAGGVGTRLWPVSRELYPKQLGNFMGTDSLVQSTLKRLSPALDADGVRIVCGREHGHEIRRHMTEIGIAPKGKVICEPCGRNTAPAILLGVFHVLSEQSDATVCVFPADHVIRDVEEFHRKIRAAVKLAERGHIVTFGIKPHYPETGYGYIEGAAHVSDGALSIRRFVEKPERKDAEDYLRAGNFFWNSGMFAFRASVMMEEFRSLAPAVFQGMEKMMRTNSLSLSAYQALPDISIDYAIMEKTDKGVVLPSDFGWSDVGSWKSLYDFLEKDAHGNVIEGDVITKDTERCFILGHERLIATNSLRNMAIIETPDSVFVSNLDNSRDVKEIVETLKAQDRKEFKFHRTVYHPWGSTTLLDEQSDSIVRRVVVYTGATYRTAGGTETVRHVTVAAGGAAVSEENTRRILAQGVSISLSKNAAADIENIGKTPLTLIEVEIDMNPSMGNNP